MTPTTTRNPRRSTILVALLLVTILTGTTTTGVSEDNTSTGFSVEATNIPLESESLVRLSVSGSEAEPVRALADSVDLAISIPESECSDCALVLETDDQVLASFSFDLDPYGIEVWDLYLHEGVQVSPDTTICRFTMGTVEGLVGFIATSLEETPVELKIDLDASGGPYGPDERVEVPKRGTHEGRVVYATSLAVRSLPVVSWEAAFGEDAGESARGEVSFLRNQVTGTAQIEGDGVQLVYAQAERTSDLLAAELPASAFRPQIEPDWQDGGSGTELRWAALGLEKFDTELLGFLNNDPVPLGFASGGEPGGEPPTGEQTGETSDPVLLHTLERTGLAGTAGAIALVAFLGIGALTYLAMRRQGTLRQTGGPPLQKPTHAVRWPLGTLLRLPLDGGEDLLLRIRRVNPINKAGQARVTPIQAPREVYAGGVRLAEGETRLLEPGEEIYAGPYTLSYGSTATQAEDHPTGSGVTQDVN